MRKKHFEEFAQAIALEINPEIHDMDTVIMCANVLRRVGSKYNPRYDNKRMISSIIENLKQLNKLHLLVEDKTC